MFIELTPANSPKTITAQDVSELVNFPFLAVKASGGGTLVLNLPNISTLIGNGNIYVLCSDSSTVTINANEADSITSAGTVTSSISITGSNTYANLQSINLGSSKLWLNNSAGSGSGSVQLLSFDVTIPAATVNSLLNQTTTQLVLIPAPASANQLIQLYSCQSRNVGSFATPRDGTAPQLQVYSVEVGVPLFETPKVSGFNFFVNNPNFWSYSLNPDNVYSTLASTGSGTTGAIFIGSPTNAGVTQGSNDLRIIGTYSIKQL